MGSRVYEFSVEMTCEGCANAVKNALSKKDGVNNVQTDLGQKKVIVDATLSADEVLEIIKKTGKACQYIKMV